MIKGHLRVILAEKDLQLKDFSDKSKINQGTLIDIKKERSRNISIKTLNKLCKALNCTVGDLFEYIPDEPDNNQMNTNTNHSPNPVSPSLRRENPTHQGSL